MNYRNTAFHLVDLLRTLAKRADEYGLAFQDRDEDAARHFWRLRDYALHSTKAILDDREGTP